MLDSIPCPKCGRAAAAEFSVRRYEMVERVLTLVAIDRDYHCDCGGCYSHREMPVRGQSGPQTPVEDALLALLNGAFDLFVLRQYPWPAA
jgi:hypothetical protein